MAKERSPGALAGVTGADQDAAGQQLDQFTKSEIAAPSGRRSTGKKRRPSAPTTGKTTPEERHDDAAEIRRLAALPALQYDREREPAAERLGIRVSTLDNEVEAARQRERPSDTEGFGKDAPIPDTGGRGRALQFPA